MTYMMTVYKIQTHERFKRTLFIRTKTKPANCRGNPLCQATKRHSSEHWTGKQHISTKKQISGLAFHLVFSSLFAV